MSNADPKVLCCDGFMTPGTGLAADSSQEVSDDEEEPEKEEKEGEVEEVDEEKKDKKVGIVCLMLQHLILSDVSSRHPLQQWSCSCFLHQRLTVNIGVPVVSYSYVASGWKSGVVLRQETGAGQAASL